MCGITPYMANVATNHGISVIYHSVALLISTTGVVYIYIYIHKCKYIFVLCPTLQMLFDVAWYSNCVLLYWLLFIN